MIRLLGKLIHFRGYEWVSADVINAETGTMDDYCTCWFCKRFH